MIDQTSTLMSAGFPLVGGGMMGFCIGYFLKKLLKVVIFAIGLIFAIIAFLQYKKLIIVDWATIQNQSSIFLQHSTQQVLNAVNNTAQNLDHNNLNHLDVAYPLLGISGFVPGLIFGMTRG